jgi:hypothetical protein
VGRQLLAQPQGDEPAVAQVADRGDPGRQRRPCPGAAVGQQRVITGGLEVADGVAAGVQRQMDVAVDQPRQEGRLPEVDQLGALRRVGTREVDIGDAPLVDQHQRAGAQPVGHPVKQPPRTDRKHLIHLALRSTTTLSGQYVTWTPSALTGQVARVCSVSGSGRQVVATSTGVR